MKMKSWMTASLALGLSAGVAAPAMAVDWGTGAAWYIGLSGGESRSQAGGGDIGSALTSNGLVPLSSSLDDTDTGWKIYLGNQINQNFAVEIGYIDFGEFGFGATTAGGALSGTLDSERGGFIDALGIIPLANNFSVFGKVGGYTVRTELKGSGAGGSVSSSDRSSDWKYGLGAGYDFNRNMGVRVEWERFNDVGDTSTTQGDMDLTSIGVVYKF